VTDYSPSTVISGVEYEVTEVDGEARPLALLDLLGWHRLVVVYAGGHSSEIEGCGVATGPDLLFKEKVHQSGKDARTWKITSRSPGVSAEALSAF
jgi:hypothetical protein